jgi:hypothetical protein
VGGVVIVERMSEESGVSVEYSFGMNSVALQTKHEWQQQN